MFQHISKHLKVHQKYCAGEFFLSTPFSQARSFVFDILHINVFSQESYLHDLMLQKLVFMILSSADIAVHYV